MSANWSPSASRRSFQASTVVALRQEVPAAWQAATRFAESVPDFSVARFPFAALWRLVFGFLIAATIVIVLTNPSGAQAPAASNGPAASQHDSSLFAQCLLDWDRATHMTKTEWSGACQRVARQRGNPAQASEVFRVDRPRRIH